MASLAGLFGNNKGFDASAVDPSKPFEAIPPGEYKAIISASELAPNKNGTGRNLKLEFKVVDGPHKGRTIFNWLSLQNPSAQAVEIAQRNFSAICHAVGVLQVNDSSQLHGKPLLICIKLEERDNGNKTNTVTGYKPLSSPSSSPNEPVKKDDVFDNDVPF